HIRSPVGCRGVPELVYELFELRGLRARVAEQVELAIQDQELLGVVAHATDALGQVREAVQVGGVETGRAVAEQQRFEPLAHLVDLFALREREARDPGARVRDDGDQALELELSDRLAHGYSARTVLGGE